LACQSRAFRSPANRPKSNREKGFREFRRQRSAPLFFPELFADSADHRSDAAAPKLQF